MARDGSGNYSLPEAAFVSNTTISSTKVNNNFSDIATAIAGSLAANGEKAATGNQPMGGFKHTGVGDAAARTHYASAGQVQDGSINFAGTTAGTSTAYTASLTPAIAAYASGAQFVVRFNATCGASPTLNINSVGAKTLKKQISTGLVALAAGDIQSGQIGLLEYDSTADALIVLAPTWSVSPAMPTASAGVGNWVLVNPGDGNAATLTAGGTWAYYINRYFTASGAADGNAAGSVAAGGTTIGAALAGRYWNGFAWRIA